MSIEIIALLIAKEAGVLANLGLLFSKLKAENRDATPEELQAAHSDRQAANDEWTALAPK